MGGNAGDIIVDSAQAIARSAVVCENIADTAKARLARIAAKAPGNVTIRDFKYLLDCIQEAHETLKRKGKP